MSVRIDLPFRLFFNRLKNSVARKERQTRLIFEALEDRQLLSVSDPTGVGAATTMIVSSVSAAQLELDSPISLNEADLAAAGDESGLVILSEQEALGLVSSGAIANFSPGKLDDPNLLVNVASTGWTSGKRWFYYDDGMYDGKYDDNDTLLYRYNWNDDTWTIKTHAGTDASEDEKRDENVGRLFKLIDRAEELGLNGMVWRCCVGESENSVGSDRESFLIQVKEYAEERNIEIIPTFWHVGVGAFLDQDPTLVEGKLIEEVPMTVNGGAVDDVLVFEENFEENEWDHLEEGGWNLPGGWKKSDNVLIVEGQKGYNNSQSICITLKDTKSDYIERNYGKNAGESLEEGYYYATCMVKIEANGGAATWHASEVIIEDSDGTVKAKPYYEPNGNRWTMIKTEPFKVSLGEIRIALRCTGAVDEKFWFDNLQIHKVNSVKSDILPIPREGTPIKLFKKGDNGEMVPIPQKNANGTTNWQLPNGYKENFKYSYDKGFYVIIDGVERKGIGIDDLIPGDSPLRSEGVETVYVSYYAPEPNIWNQSRYSVCLSEDELYEFMRTSAIRIQNTLQPKTWFLAFDEVFIGATCETCQELKDSLGLTTAQIFGRSVTKQYEIIKDVIKGQPNSNAEIVVWSDMFDDKHNANDEYLQAGGSLKDAVDYIPNDLIIACWYDHDASPDEPDERDEYMRTSAVALHAKETLNFFSSRGFRTMASCYYDWGGDPRKGYTPTEMELDCLDFNTQGWLTAISESSNLCNVGMLYTTWSESVAPGQNGDYDYLNSFGVALNQVKKLQSNKTIASVSLSQSVPVVGQPLTATLSPSANAQTAATYQWYRMEKVLNDEGQEILLDPDGNPWQIWKAISGAAGATYTPTAADKGKELKVVAVGVGDYAGTASAKSKAVVSSVAVPAAPSKLVFGAYDFATQTLPMSWKDNSNNETKFVTQFSYDGVKWNRGGETAANVTSRVATGVAPNRKYYFRVAAYNEAGYSGWTYGEYQTPPAVPAAPTKLVFTGYSAKNRTVQMSWTDNSDDETGFVVQYSVDGGLTWRNSAVLGANVTSRVATSISENCVYRFRVAAKNAYGLSEWLEGAYEAADTPNPNLAAPSALVFSDYSSVKKTARMSWTDNSNNETSFVVQYSVDGGFSWRDAATLGKNVTSRVATGLSPGRDYHFRVAAQNAAGRSEWLYGKVGADGVVNENLSAPSALKFSNYSSESQTVKMTWKDNSKDELGFLVQYSVDGGATWRDSATLGANVSTRQASGLVPNRVYNFRVAAFNSDGYSAWVYGEFQTPSQIPAAPRDLVFSGYSPENRTVVMTWKDASTNETGFKVEYSVDGGETWRASANLAANTTSRVATGIVAERKYDFRVAAKNAYGLSEWCYGSFTISNGALTASSAVRASAALLAAYEDASLFEDAPTDDYFELLGDVEFSFDDAEF